MSDLRFLGLGEPLPLVSLPSNRNPRFALGSIGGRFLLLCAVADRAKAERALAALQTDATPEGARVTALLLADGAPDDARVTEIARAKVVFRDPEARLAALFASPDFAAGRWILFDPSLRVLAYWPLDEAEAALEALARTPAPDAHAGVPLHAPVLIAPRIFESAFCQQLIAYYQKQGGTPSGTTRESADGKTFVAPDPSFKRRDDCLLDDKSLREAAMQRIFHRLLPEIEKAFMWRATRMERYLVARYAADDGGFFRPHRDNTTKGTAHRRFAVTINLNAEAYEGGDLRFPEYGGRLYRAPTGGAVVFACSLLHEATPVTRGERYAFLPFLYDDAAAVVRAANNAHLDDSVTPYRG